MILVLYGLFIFLEICNAVAIFDTSNMSHSCGGETNRLNFLTLVSTYMHIREIPQSGEGIRCCILVSAVLRVCSIGEVLTLFSSTVLFLSS